MDWNGEDVNGLFAKVWMLDYFGHVAAIMTYNFTAFIPPLGVAT